MSQLKTQVPAESIRHGPNISSVVPKVAQQIALMESGPAAALRRGPLAGAGAAPFWKLMAEYNIQEWDIEAWADVVQAIAILTPITKSEEKAKTTAHDSSRSMGSILHGAGISELRLARLLGAKGPLRRELMVRTCRRLARKSEYRRFDLRTLAWFILREPEKTDQEIAKDYYRADRRAHDSAQDKSSQTKEQ